MRDTRYEKGFTLAELLVALMVTGIILAAVATLAYALGTASDAMDDMSQKQAQVRYATLRISELIRHCKLICSKPGDDLVIWRADDNGDGKINVNELVYIETGTSQNLIRLCEFYSVLNPVKGMSDIQTPEQKQQLRSSYDDTYTTLIPECSNVRFVTDEAPPWSKRASVSFDLAENGVVHQYQINTALRSWAGHLLDWSGDIVSGDDD